MPDLPDVAVLCKTVDKSRNKSIKKTYIYRNRMFKTSDQSLRSNLEGSRLLKKERHSKYLFIGIDNSKWLIIYFGMTGNIYYNDAEAEKSILVIDFKEGMKLSITSTRKLGRIDLTESMGKYIKSLKLGPDANESRKRIIRRNHRQFKRNDQKCPDESN